MSSDYWRKREEEWLEECEKEENKWAKEIQKVYEDMIDEIEEQIAVWYQRYGDGANMTMQEAKEYLSKTDMEWYAQKAKEYCRLAQLDRNEGTNKRSKIYFSEQANEEMARYNTVMKINRLKMIESQIRLRVLHAQAKIQETIEEGLMSISENEIERLAGILGNTVLDNWKGAETIVHASFHGATFSKRIWGPQQINLQKALNKALENSIILGKNPKACIKDFRAIAGGTAKQAQRLLLTESARVQTQVQIESFKNSGFDEYEFMANPKCCEHCQEMDGKHFEIKKDSIESKAPPLHPNCRCYISPYIDENKAPEDSELWDEWAETYDDHGLSWGERKDIMSDDKQLILTNAELRQTVKDCGQSIIDNASSIAGRYPFQCDELIITIRIPMGGSFPTVDVDSTFIPEGYLKRYNCLSDVKEKQ